MKTLIISGSPRKNGDSMTLINEMTKHLDGEIKIVHTYFDHISPCIDCRYCWQNDACLIDDAMQTLYKLINEVDNIILASPLYFSELTGSLLNFASRLQCFFAFRYMRKNADFQLKRKKAVLVLTGGGDGSPEPAIERAGIIFRQINAEPIGTVMSLRTNNIPAKEDVEAMSQARELALKLRKNMGGPNDSHSAPFKLERQHS